MKKWFVYPDTLSRSAFVEFLNENNLQPGEVIILEGARREMAGDIHFAYFAAEQLH